MTYPDIARFGYGSGYTGVGAVPTPLVTGISSFSGVGNGASDPVGAYYQEAASNPFTGGYTGNGYAGTGYYPTVPGAPNSGSGSGGGLNLGMNIDTAKLALGGLATIGSLWQAWEANKLAKEQFKFQKDITETNLANQIQSYNTTLEDRTRARAHTEGMSAADAQAYIDANRLRRS